MKHVAIMACVLAASVMPTATAQVMENANSRAYEITLSGEIIPASLGDLSYPYKSASRGQNGHCDLKVQTDAHGAVEGVEVASCSNKAFQAEIERNAPMGLAQGEAGSISALRVDWRIQ